MKKRSASRDAFFNPRVLLGFGLGSAGVALALVALSFSSPSIAVAQEGAHSPKPIIIRSVYNDVSPAMRDVEPWPVQRVQEHEAAENPKIFTGQHKDKPDLVIQKGKLLGELAPNIPAPILNFAGIPFPGVSCSCAPPDTNGEVGATQYVQMVNEGYQVFDKTTGASILGPNSIGSIWTGMGGVCQTSGQGDPVVVYDQIANRWLISQFANGLHDECIAVSTTNDATGTYNRYDFHLGSSNLFDYPKIGVWPDGYYMSMNLFNSSGTAYFGPQVFAFDRAAMIAGNTATMITFPALGATFPPILPADLDGSTLPPAGAPNSFVLLPDTGTYRVYHFHADFANPTNSTFSLFGSSPAAGYTELCPATRDCIPALGASTPGNKMDGIADRLMFRLGYRNIGGHESMVGNFTVSTGGSTGPAGIRWFELRGVTAGPVTTFQESTYGPDSTNRWMGSIAMNGQGDMALGFSASDATIHPQIRYTGRLGTDPINTLPQGEAHLFDGNGSQTGTSNRWGDYSDMTVDPVDDCTFWYTQEYYDTVSAFNWRTRIGSFRVGTCGGGGGANLVSAASRLTQGAAGSFDINMPLSGPSGSEDRIASTYTAVFTFDTAVTSGNVTVASGTATVGAITFSGNEMRAALTGVADVQNVTLHVSGVNGGGATADVPFGFLQADANGNRVVDKPDSTSVKANQGAVTSANFRNDINADGAITRNDEKLIKPRKGHSLP